MAELTCLSKEGSVVQKNKAKNELAQHLLSDPLPLCHAKITQEAAVKKAAQVAKEAAQQASAARTEAKQATHQALQACAAAEEAARQAMQARTSTEAACA